MEDEAGLREWYDELSESMRREIGKWVMGVKSEEARMRRAQQMAERLLATMEAERELPPVIARALRSQAQGEGRMGADDDRAAEAASVGRVLLSDAGGTRASSAEAGGSGGATCCR